MLLILTQSILLAILITNHCFAAEGIDEAVLEGVYTVDHVKRGGGVFKNICQQCHTPQDFNTIFQQAPDLPAIISDYHDLIQLTMPQDSPGSLTKQMYLDVIAYLLYLNEIPPSNETLE